jgi:hypothetical protein
MRGLTSQDIPALQKVAELGDARSQNLLGMAYQWGVGVTADSTKAVYWLRKAAEQGSASAETCLGNLYMQGQGVVKDDSQAMQ